MHQSSFRQQLENFMSKGTQRDVTAEPLRSAIARLSTEGEYLLSTGRHAWVRSRVTDLNDTSNWSAYAMEVHFTYTLEKVSHAVQNSAPLIQGDNSDVDIVYKHANGIEVRMECVSMLEPASYWQGNIEVSPGVTFKRALYDGDGEAGLLRRVQHKLRTKTIRPDGRPLKFPPADTNTVNVIIADVSSGAGYKLDRWDLELLSWGNAYVGPTERRPLLGLFEPSNPYGPKFEAEFTANRFFRERIRDSPRLNRSIGQGVWSDFDKPLA